MRRRLPPAACRRRGRSSRRRLAAPAGSSAARPAARSTWSPPSTRCSSSAERIGGDAVTVTNLTKPGAEPHDLELTPRQVGQISDAELVVYLKGFQPAVDEAVDQEAGDRAFDVGHGRCRCWRGRRRTRPRGRRTSTRTTSGGKDPHVWLDPTRLATIGERARRAARPRPTRRTPPTTRARAADAAAPS